MKVVCPGSYDPVTVGHIDVAARASVLFDEVVIAVVHNPAKSGNFPVAQRVELIERGLAEDPRSANADNISIDDVPGGLLVDYCARIGASAVVKGLRSGTDFAYELPMALMNRHLTELETIFIPGDPRYEHVSSSLIREVHSLGGDVAGLVPTAVLEAMDEKLSLRRG
ncbi:pantetheine-phosphate adenylyltransferase [Brevibacterium daeguense]|uniref:Phosphopantetheine adenylyltransferase n=1 Tax=Brevibacterium daeguense TaxID=909936 RepID=A0ABP8EMF3_9MICO|nr:pantetheine-phosphate adenylyltransferase [Brevibacterium daeguense]